MTISQYLATFGSIGTAVALQLYQAKSIECDTIKFELNEKIEALTDNLNLKTKQLEDFDKINGIYVNDVKDENAKHIKDLEHEIKTLKQSKTAQIENTSAAGTELDQLTSLVDEYKNKIAHLESKLTTTEQERDAATTNFEVELHARIDTLISEKDFTIQKLTEQCREVEKLKEGLESAFKEEKARLSKKITDIGNELAAKTVELEKQSKALKDVREENVVLKEARSSLTAELNLVKEASGSAVKQEAKLAQVEKELAEARGKLDQLEMFKVNLRKLNERYSNKDLVLEAKSADLSILHQYLEALLKQITTLNGALAEYKKKVALSKDTEEKLKEQLAQAEIKINSKLAEAEKLFKSQLLESENKVKSDTTDFKLYDIVKSRIDLLYNHIKNLYPEIENIEAEEEEFEIEETLESDAFPSDSVHGETADDDEKIKQDSEQEVENEPTFAAKKEVQKVTTILKGNSETKKTTQIIKAFESIKQDYDKRLTDKERLTTGFIEKFRELNKIKSEQDEHFAKVKEELQNSQKLTETYKEQISSVEQTASQLEQQLSESKKTEAHIEILKQENQTLSQENEVLTTQNRTLLAARMKLDETIVEDDRIRQRLSQENAQLKHNLDSKDTLIARLRAQISDLQNKEEAFEANHIKLQQILASDPNRKSNTEISDRAPLENEQLPVAT